MNDNLNGATPAPSAAMLTLPGTGKSYDLAQAFPLTLGDWAALEDAGVVGDNNTIKFTAKNAISMLTSLLKKLDETVTPEQVAKVPMDTLNVLGALMADMAKRNEEAVARPTPPPS